MNRNLESARERQKKYYDQLVKHSKAINVGDLVLIRNFVLTVGHNKAFEAKFLGPFRVVRKIGDVLLEICKAEGKVNVVVHINRVKRFNERSDSTQVVRDSVRLTNNSPVQTIHMRTSDTIISGVQFEFWTWMCHLSSKTSTINKERDEERANQAVEEAGEAPPMTSTVGQEEGEAPQVTSTVGRDDEDSLPPLESTVGDDTLYQSMMDRTVEKESNDDKGPTELDMDTRTRYGRKIVPVDKFQAGHRK